MIRNRRSSTGKMRIEGLPPAIRQALIAAAAARVEPFRAETGGGEPPPPSAIPPAAAGAVGAQPPTSVAMLVALAATDPVAERRRKAAATDRGLSLLEALRDELELGLASPEQLHQLADWVGGFAIPDDPELATLAREVELRVRVELAKHDLTA